MKYKTLLPVTYGPNGKYFALFCLFRSFPVYFGPFPVVLLSPHTTMANCVTFNTATVTSYAEFRILERGVGKTIKYNWIFHIYVSLHTCRMTIKSRGRNKMAKQHISLTAPIQCVAIKRFKTLSCSNVGLF